MSHQDTGALWGQWHNWSWNGFRSHWRVLGKGNQVPMLLLHGFGAHSAHWRNNACFFANAGFKVYGLDLIGFGQSDQPTSKQLPKLNNQFWAEQVIAFLEEIVQSSKNKKTIIIGNSLGSLTAVNALLLRQDLISAVIAAPLPDPALVQNKRTSTPNCLESIRRLIINIIFHLIPLEIIVPLISRTGLIRLGLQFAYHHSVKSDQELNNLIAKPARREGAAMALRAMCIGMATRPRSFTAPFFLEMLSKQSFRSPILLLWGREDKLVPLQIGQRLLQEHPWLELAVLENTGHCPHDESPKEFNQYVLKWLDLNLDITRQEA